MKTITRRRGYGLVELPRCAWRCDFPRAVEIVTDFGLSATLVGNNESATIYCVSGPVGGREYVAVDFEAWLDENVKAVELQGESSLRPIGRCCGGNSRATMF